MAETVSRANARFSQADTDRIRALALASLHYDPLTGILTWKVRRANRCRVGDVAGSLCRYQGYVTSILDNTKYKAHRLIWLMVYGEWPKLDVDHINGVRSDNRLCNLRLATNQQNCANGRRRKKSGLKGAVWKPVGRKWEARCSGRYIGTFRTEFEAHQAYMAAATEKYGNFARAS